MAGQIVEMVPVFGIESYADAKAHYVGWLGFTIDWEWREAEGQPVIMAISRDHAAFMLNEYDKPAPSTVTLKVDDLESLAAEWNVRKPGSVDVAIEPPYEFPAVLIRDPWGNALHFQQSLTAAEEAVRAETRERMREHVRALRAAGKPFPTPAELREAIGPALGTAVEVLNEFSDYAVAYDARRPPDA